MNEFNPGDGWREVREPADTGDGDEVRWRSSDDSAVRYWVRVAPVPPLPTEPYTVIRVKWADNGEPDALVCSGADWHSLFRGPVYAPSRLAEQITGFEVLAEPRAVTAKAFLDRVRQEGLIQLAIAANPRNGDAFDAIGRDFGVES